MAKEGSTFAKFPKNSLFVQVDLKTSLSSVAISAAAGQRFGVLTENLAHTMAKTFSEFSTKHLESPQHLRVVSDHDLGLLRQWNKMPPTGVVRCVHDLIIERAQRQPKAPALAAWDGDLTYGDLNALSYQLAVLLHEEGVRANTIVALYFEKSKWTTVAMLGTLRAGGAFVLIDTAFPLQRAIAMVRHVNATILLASSMVPSGLRVKVSISITLDDDLFSRLPPPMWSFSCDAVPQDSALVLFTSGSTGTPKAILQDHIAASTTADGLGRAWDLTGNSRVLQFATYAFDMSVIDTLMALVNGACLCVPSQDDIMSNLGAVIQQMRINFSAVTPSVATTYPSGIEQTLQTLVLGGEKVPKALLEFWTKRLTVFNAYGPAEASVCALGQAQISRSMSIGRPMNTLAWVVDETDHNILKPIGAVGELLLEGPMLAKGYLKDPEKTRSLFVENPAFFDVIFGVGQGEARRLYKSGDLVRLYPDGCLDYLGRKDLQIKLRGQRIELSEVEYHLQKVLEKGCACIVDVVEVDTGSILAAFIENAKIGSMMLEIEGIAETKELQSEVSTTSPRVREIKERLKKSLEAALPAFMVPSAFFFVRKLPLTASQKIDRTSLKRLGREAWLRQRSINTMGDQISHGPTSGDGAEKYLRDQWKDILRLDLVSIRGDSHFLELGGNSLLAMRLASRLHSRWPASRISVRDIFANPTLQMQRRLITSALCDTYDDPNPSTQAQTTTTDPQLRRIMCAETGFEESEIEDVLEATDFQSEVIASELTKDAAEVHYCTFSFSAAIDTSRLQHAIRAFANHYTIFRTCFVAHEHKLFQVVLKSAPCSLIKCTGGQEDVLREIDGKPSEFDVELRGRALYLQRFNIHSAGPNTSRMTLRISHALFDGGYDGGFMRRALLELKALYHGEALLRSPPFSAFCSTRISGLPAGIEYWKQLLRDSEPSRLVAKRAPSDMNLLCSEVVRSVQVSTMPRGITPATLMKAAWSLVLSAILHKEDVVFGSIGSGRGFPIECADTIMGPCINTIPVRVRIEDMMTRTEILSQVQDQYLASALFETVGLQTIVRKCTNWPLWEDLSTVVNDLSEENFLDQLDESIPFDGGICTATVCQNPGKWTDIAVETRKDGDQMHARLYFSGRVFSKELIEDLGDMLVANIKILSSGGEAPVSSSATGPVLSRTQFPLAPAADGRTALDHAPSGPWPQEAFIVREAWRSVLNCDVLRRSPMSESASAPFYDSWPLVSAYPLYKFYSDKGFAVNYDDIIMHPSAESQMWLLHARSQHCMAADENMEIDQGA
jgi:amino acid adenylation domain-containing protein